MQHDDLLPGQTGAPNLQTRTVVGVFESRGQAEQALQALERAGYPSDQISIVTQESERAPEIGAGDTYSNEAGVGGMAVGAVVGGALAGLTALAIPGVGAFLAAGPIAGAITAALGGALTGSAVGVLGGSFAGLGVPKEHAEQYAEAVRAGGIVLAVKVPGEQAVDPVCTLLKQQGARESLSFEPAL